LGENFIEEVAEKRRESMSVHSASAQIKKIVLSVRLTKRYFCFGKKRNDVRTWSEPIGCARAQLSGHRGPDLVRFFFLFFIMI
jgi:hypothetical protein